MRLKFQYYRPEAENGSFDIHSVRGEHTAASRFLCGNGQLEKSAQCSDFSSPPLATRFLEFVDSKQMDCEFRAWHFRAGRISLESQDFSSSPGFRSTRKLIEHSFSFQRQEFLIKA